MQADNLNQDNVEKLAKLFGEMQKDNPELTFRMFDLNKVQRKDCLFKEKCQSKGRKI